MKHSECQIGIPVMHGCSSGNKFFPSGIEGIVTALRKNVTCEKGRKQYTIEFGKRKAYFPEIKITDWYATVTLTDGDDIEINIENLRIKPRR